MDNRDDSPLSDDESKISVISESYDQSLAYRILEEDFSVIIEDLCRHDRLGHYANEFQRLIDALRESHEKERKLVEKNRSLKHRVTAGNTKLIAAAKLSQSDQETIEHLEEEIKKAWKIIDAAHTREQNAQETIENLRLQSARLTQELETMRKMGSDQEQEAGVLSKNKEAMAREKERLLAEITYAREKYQNGLKYQEELEKMNDEAERKLSEVSSELATHKTELAREKRFKETLEEELKELKSNFAEKNEEANQLNSQLSANLKLVTKMERQLRDEKIASDKTTKELQELNSTVKLLKLEHDIIVGKMEETQQNLATKNQDLKIKDEELSKARGDLKKAQNANNSLLTKISALVSEKGTLVDTKEELLTKIKSMERELIDVKKESQTDKKVVQDMLREKEVLTRTAQKCAAFTQEQQKLLSSQEVNKKKLQDELHTNLEVLTKLKADSSALQNEKDRLMAENLSLNTQIQDQIEKLKLKEMELYDYKKRITSIEGKLKMQLAMFEQVRAERNQFSKVLNEKSDEINEIKQKVKVKSYQAEQLKDDIRTKETMLVKEEFIRKKVLKENEEIKMDLQKATEELKEKKDLIGLLLQEEERLQKIIQEGDKDRAKLVKELHQVSNERDILGTQLVRRNDELALLQEKIKIFQSILQKGEAQYDQRLEDIRLLKIEIRKLRQEKAMLARSVNNVSDLRQELFHLERDFTRERLKCRALEEELQNPLNVHRWRKLEGSDPTAFELIQKIQILQKRLLKASQEAIKKEGQIKELERLYLNLQELYAKKPGTEIHEKLKKCQDRLKIKGVKMKCLIAELTMFENQISGFKFEKQKSEVAICDLKRKFLDLKRREQKVKQKQRDLKQEKAMLPLLEPITTKNSKTRYLGAAFNVTSVPCIPRTPSLPMNA